MSRGPGKLERAIVAALYADLTNAFTVAELCALIYRTGQPSTRSQKVAVRRAMNGVGRRLKRDFVITQANPDNGRIVIFWRDSDDSEKAARAKAHLET